MAALSPSAHPLDPHRRAFADALGLLLAELVWAEATRSTAASNPAPKKESLNLRFATAGRGSRSEEKHGEYQL